MNRSESVQELAAALAKAQAAMKPAEKDGENPHFKSRFASLASIWDACRGPLTSNGLAVIQAPIRGEDGVLELSTTLVHSSGQWCESRLPLPCDARNAQAVGSAVSYMRRYALAAMVGVVADDDDDGSDAVAAMQRRPAESARRPEPRRPDPMPPREPEDPDVEFRRYVERAMANWEKFEPFGESESRRARELRLANHVITAAIEDGKVAEAAVWKPGTQARSPGATWDALQYLHRENRTWLMAETLKYLREKSSVAKATATAGPPEVAADGMAPDVLEN